MPMKREIYKIAVICFACIMSSISFGQTLNMPGISPAMISQFSGMSPDARRAMAAQYGINIDDLGLGDTIDNNQIGAPASEIDSEAKRILFERVIENQANEDEAKELIRKNIPLFERDFQSISELPIYGQFLFDGNYSTFAPIDNAPVPNNYILGAGDSLRVLLYGTLDSEMDLVVMRDGTINFPELGSLSVAGMTFIEASQYISNRVLKQMIGVEISISVGRLKSINVFMAGEAMIPGTYSVSGLSTVSQLLFVAGGISDIGSLRNIEIRRSNKLIAKFDLYELLTQGNASGDVRLQSGDVIFVPTIKKSVFVDGAVKRPGRYELIDNEPISKLIEITGGLENRAYLKKISIERYDYKADIPSIINLDLTDNDNLNYKIMDGDIIRIAEISDRLSNSVTLIGAVKRPGKYGWFDGLRFSDLLNSIDIDFANNFDITKGMIVRRKTKINHDIEVHDFNIKNALEFPKTNMDPLIELHDEIFIFSLGFNDDSLNNIQIYDPSMDPEHPNYGKNASEDDPEEQPITAQTMTSNIDDITANQLSYKEYQVVMHESTKEAEFALINQGKRRMLLKSILEKLNQQATSSEASKIVSISGAVKIPGEYPLTADASYMDLVELAGGFKDNAYIEAAEIRQTLLDTHGSMAINTSDIDLSAFSDTKLAGRDHLHIRSVKDWDARDTVILNGEVVYPGIYLISPNETLSSVIKRAGGFTGESFIEGAVFTRESIKQKEREQLQILGDAIRRDQAARAMTKESEDFSVSSNEVEASIEALLSTEVYGRLIIDVPRLIGGDKSADLVLQDGDVLNIPKYTNAVTVVGEVRRAGSFVRKESYDLEDYLQLAAGMTDRGDDKEIYIIRADGSVQKNGRVRSLFTFDSGQKNILAGDTIVIPIKSSYQTPLNLYSTVSQVVFQSIASIAAFSTILN